MLLVLIAPHEFGHFLVAKLCNVQVNEFSVGMGPLLFKKQKGETQYSLRLIPVGGYCAMEGEDEASDNPRAFNRQGPWKRIAILIAGVTMNILIAILACTIAIQISGVPTTRIASVTDGSPAAEAGIQAGDRIVRIESTDIDSWNQVPETISAYDGEGKMEIVIRRDGSEKSVFLVPEYNEERESYSIGVVSYCTKNPFTCIGYGAQTAWNLNKLMLQSFGMIFRGEISTDDVAGPVGLVKVVDQTASIGASSYLLLLALVSLNLALVNLIPIPGLDGGKILFVILKAISRGKVTDEMEFKATMVGLAIILMLFVLITINDVRNLL